MNLEQQRDTIIDIAARHGARNVRVFGSVARGDDRPASDLDLLVDMELRSPPFWISVGLAQDLEALLNGNVDVVTTQVSMTRFVSRSLPSRGPCERPARLSRSHPRAPSTTSAAYAAVGRDAFMADRMRQDADHRKLEIIGEAVKQLAERRRPASSRDPLEADCRHARPPDPRVLQRRPRPRLGGCRARWTSPGACDCPHGPIV